MKLLLAFFLTTSALANPFEYQWQELAPGVWAAIRADPFELPQEGNAVFVATDEGVVLFDAGGSPLMGEAIVAKVRSVTKAPITHVVLSHWHGDHMRGLQSIKAAYPNAEILAHPHTRGFIADTQEKWLKRRETMVPNIRKNVAAMLAKKIDGADKTWLEHGLANVDQLGAENKRTAYVLPTATFADRLVLYLGKREIQFFCPGNAHTAGDIVMWLPQEKIVATGDIVTAPVPLMPSPYLETYAPVLEKIKSLGFTTLVPGHGAVQHDSTYVDDLIALIRSMPHAESVEERFTHGDPFLTNRFRDYVINRGEKEVF